MMRMMLGKLGVNIYLYIYTACLPNQSLEEYFWEEANLRILDSGKAHQMSIAILLGNSKEFTEYNI